MGCIINLHISKLCCGCPNANVIHSKSVSVRVYDIYKTRTTVAVFLGGEVLELIYDYY